MSTLLCCFCRSISLSLCVFYSLFFTVSLFLLSLSLNQFYRTPNALKFYLVIKIKQLKMTFFCVCVWSIWSFFRSWFSFSFRHIICLFFSIFNVLPSFDRNLYVSFLLDKRTLMCLRLLHEFGVNFDFDFLRMVFWLCVLLIVVPLGSHQRSFLFVKHSNFLSARNVVRTRIPKWSCEFPIIIIN